MSVILLAFLYLLLVVVYFPSCNEKAGRRLYANTCLKMIIILSISQLQKNAANHSSEASTTYGLICWLMISFYIMYFRERAKKKPLPLVLYT